MLSSLNFTRVALFFGTLAGAALSASPTIVVEPFATGFTQPVSLNHAGDGSGRLFVCEKAGRVLIVNASGEVNATPFLDIRNQVNTVSEQGFFSIAFHPDYETNRECFVAFTNRQSDQVVYRLQASEASADLVDLSTAVPILTIDDVQPQHNGGWLDFGPDGYLYYSMGDGGGANDSGGGHTPVIGNSQDITNPLGKMLRFDTTGAPASDNPYFGEHPGHDLIYAHGLRNPWRCSFDRETGRLFAGDVGQGTREEIDIIVRGGNYGWRIFEGNRCTNFDASPEPVTCVSPEAYVPPIHEYPHLPGFNAVIGGYVYRGPRSPELDGLYFFADHSQGLLSYLEEVAPDVWAATPVQDTDNDWSGFGEDEEGELYLCDLAIGPPGGGTVYRIHQENEVKPPLPPAGGPQLSMTRARRTLSALLFFLAANAVAAPTLAPTRFEIEQQTTLGTSVYVMGNLPELGNMDPLHALKLSPTSYPIWFAEIELPPATPIEYRYLLRLDEPEDVVNPSNFTLIGPENLTLTTDGAPLPTRSGVLRYFSGIESPVLEILEGATHRRIPLVREGDGRTIGESLWRAEITSLPSRGDWEFRIDLGGGNFDVPSYGPHYITSLPDLWLQDGGIFDYRPSPVVSPSQVFRSPNFVGRLSTRTLYIYLPRGYAQHMARRYPVIYMHDGQNVFRRAADGPFGQWNADDTADLLIRQGRIRECIIVGVSHGGGSQRIPEYRPDYSGGRANTTADYYALDVKPHIDATYRTLTGREDTATCGSSMGGIFSTYLGWERPEFAEHHGCVSSAYQTGEVQGELLVATRIREGPPRDVRLWLDSGTRNTEGEVGESGDNMKRTFAVRDALLAEGYVLGADFQHFLHLNAWHSEQWWADRLDEIFLFLFPAQVTALPPGDLPHGVLLR